MAVRLGEQGVTVCRCGGEAGRTVDEARHLARGGYIDGGIDGDGDIDAGAMGQRTHSSGLTYTYVYPNLPGKAGAAG